MIDTCLTCKYWEHNLEGLSYPIVHDDSFTCKVIGGGYGDLVTAVIDQGQGWDAGGATLEEIETRSDFGCVKWEKQ